MWKKRSANGSTTSGSTTRIGNALGIYTQCSGTTRQVLFEVEVFEVEEAV